MIPVVYSEFRKLQSIYKFLRDKIYLNEDDTLV